MVLSRLAIIIRRFVFALLAAEVATSMCRPHKDGHQSVQRTTDNRQKRKPTMRVLFRCVCVRAIVA